MQHEDSDNTQTSYDKVAAEYARQYLPELEHKPLDRELLDRFARLVKEVDGRVCDLGCGPGQIARYLHERGVDVFGIDLSPGMVEQAQRANPGIHFQQGDMRALALSDDSLAGIAAFYSLIHIPRDEVASVLKELRRVLRPGGVLLLSFHIGDEVIHLDEWWGKPVSVDFTFLERDEMEGYLRAAGFVLEDVVERLPYPEIEYQSRRAYIFARKPPRPPM